MKAFHNDQSIKDKYVKRVIAHQASDNLIRGTGWANGRGCAVGCTLENYDHSRYPIELGIPEWLARVEDTLFDGMSLEKSKTWPEVFLKSITVGDDLERVKAPFLIMVLESVLQTFDHDKNPEVVKAINGSIALWKREDIGSDDWNEAAESAAWAAEAAEAVGAAALAARAVWAAAWAAEEAGAVWAVAWAVGAAEAAGAVWAVEATGAAKYDYFADQLIEIIKKV